MRFFNVVFADTNFQYDVDWAEQREASNQRDRQVLQGRLSAAQSHLHKEAIRSAYVALAQHDVQTGNSRDAMGFLLRATDYCTNRSQTAHLSLLILELALALSNYQQVRDYVTKVELTLGGTTSSVAAGNSAHAAAGSGGAAASGTSSASSTHLVATKLKIVSGLERLARGDYITASNTFTTLLMSSAGPTSSTPASPSAASASSPSSTSSWEWSAVTCNEDIALYASLLALATQDRSQIIQLAEHPEALELVPAMKELLIQFSRANYQACIACFVSSSRPVAASASVMASGDSKGAASSGTGATMLPFLMGGDGGTTDLYLTKHWSALCTRIRDRCLMEYLKPYQCVQLDIMAEKFRPMTADELQDILVDLIGRGLVPNARMDVRSKVLAKSVSSESDSSSKALQRKLSKLEHRILDDTYALLVRLACLENEISVQDTNSGSGGRGGRRAAARGAGAYDDGFRRAGIGGHELDDDLSSDDEGDTPMLDVSGDHHHQINPEDLY